MPTLNKLAMNTRFSGRARDAFPKLEALAHRHAVEFLKPDNQLEHRLVDWSLRFGYRLSLDEVSAIAADVLVERAIEQHPTLVAVEGRLRDHYQRCFARRVLGQRKPSHRIVSLSDQHADRFTVLRNPSMKQERRSLQDQLRAAFKVRG